MIIIGRFFPINPHSYNSINYNNSNPNPAPPSEDNILGTDDRGKRRFGKINLWF